MSDIPREMLVQLIARRGRSLAGDARQCQALLADTLRGQYGKQVKALAASIRVGAVADLLARGGGIPASVLLSRLARRLHDEEGTDGNLARWAVESWALALNLIQADELQRISATSTYEQNVWTTPVIPAGPLPESWAPPPSPPIPTSPSRSKPEDLFRATVRQLLESGLAGTAEGKERVQHAAQVLELTAPEARRIIDEVKAERKTARRVPDRLPTSAAQTPDEASETITVARRKPPHPPQSAAVTEDISSPLEEEPEPLRYPRRRRSPRPHRGGFLLTLAIIGLFCLPYILGPIVWLLASGDLRAMRSGTMDSSGESTTKTACILGIIATCYGSVCFFLCCGMMILPSAAGRH